MAFLKPAKLTCPTCSLTGMIQVVVGVGPLSRKGDIPYQSYNKTGPFTEHLDAHGKKTGSLLCPKDGTPVWTNRPSATMEGPLTEREISRLPLPGPFHGPPNPRDSFDPRRAHLKRAAQKSARRFGGPVKRSGPKKGAF